eukprot:TRINITY_DN12352_c0_g1_i1.p1 TRINITY_DN12352_c0_g1~~TRINITY_DN12352_c0_g1_i1.p1  ORF type:complete len:241 (-),score=52.09 TRINITY_DN12352_c0_g1_i1:26-748(-)
MGQVWGRPKEIITSGVNVVELVETQYYDLKSMRQATVPDHAEASKLNSFRTDYVLCKKDGQIVYFGGSRPSITQLTIEGTRFLGTNNGEWGGSLSYNQVGGQVTKLMSGNIVSLFDIQGDLFILEGLSHLGSSHGQLCKATQSSSTWTVSTLVELESGPYAGALTEEKDIVVVTSRSLLKVTLAGQVQELIKDAFWKTYLYPTSVLVEDGSVYIGMRGGVAKVSLTPPYQQEWYIENDHH